MVPEKQSGTVPKENNFIEKIIKNHGYFFDLHESKMHILTRIFVEFQDQKWKKHCENIVI